MFSGNDRSAREKAALRLRDNAPGPCLRGHARGERPGPDNKPPELRMNSLKKKKSELLNTARRSFTHFLISKASGLALNYLVLGIVSHFINNALGVFLGQALGYLAGKTLYFILDSRLAYQVTDHSFLRGLRFISLEVLFALGTSLAFSLANFFFPGQPFTLWIVIMAIAGLIEYILVRFFVYGEVSPDKDKK